MNKGQKLAVAALTAVALGTAGVAGVAYAERGWGGHGKHHGFKGHGMGLRHGIMKNLIKRHDVDNDGKITREEVSKTQQDLVKKYDSDNDGSLSLEEFKPLWLDISSMGMVRVFQFFDANGDSGVTFSEVDAPTDHMFDRMDRNDDGVVSKDDRRRRGWRHRDRGEKRKNAE